MKILQQQEYIQARYAGALIAALNNQVCNNESTLKVSSYHQPLYENLF